MEPYTYLIGWSKQQMYYYGTRYSKNCQPNELWKTYFTSSNHVSEYRKIHGEPDIIQIRKTFLSSESARNWEHKVLRRMKVTKNRNKWINRTDNKAVYYERTNESIEKFKSKMKGRKSPFKGKSHTFESKQKVSQANKGRKSGRTSEDFTPEWRANITKSQIGRIRIQSDEEKKDRSLNVSDSFRYSTRGRVWINNGTKNKRVYPDEIISFKGYTLGRTYHPRTL